MNMGKIKTTVYEKLRTKVTWQWI